jgi:beta-hydroxylase
LRVPSPGPLGVCRIRVGEELRSYAEGKAIVFDDSVSHEVWNDAREARVVLLLNFRRPMRRPGRWLNAAFLAALRRTAYVGDARRLFLEWESRYYPADADDAAHRRER